MKRFCAVTILALFAALLPSHGQAQRWSADRANQWYRELPWLVGCNFAPSSAINQLEMWQQETFDPTTIDRELGWAHSLGMNTVRVYLHDIPWRTDPRGFLDRIDRFLEMADRHEIRPMLVLFDGVWDPEPRPGPQRSPRPHLHNSGWVQGPGAAILSDAWEIEGMESYVKGVIGRFRNDGRVLAWDLFNEPDNPNRNSYPDRELPNKTEAALCLLRKSFQWAREVGPRQPLTAGIWRGDWSEHERLPATDRFMMEESDIVTFHNYGPLEDVRERVEQLRRYGRPVLCTEYMARTNGSTFETILPFFKEEMVGSYSWGFVAGKSQTIYPWESWRRTFTAEPEIWFHDILRQDGSAFDSGEVELIKRLTGR